MLVKKAEQASDCSEVNEEGFPVGWVGCEELEQTEEKRGGEEPEQAEEEEGVHYKFKWIRE